MIVIDVTIEVPLTTAKDVYILAPARGVVSAAKAVYNEETDEDETVDILRATTSVNKITPPADATAEGTVVTGVPDATNKALVFDPASSTVANQVMKVSMPNTFDTAGMLGLTIWFDDSAFVEQTSVES